MQTFIARHNTLTHDSRKKNKRRRERDCFRPKWISISECAKHSLAKKLSYGNFSSGSVNFSFSFVYTLGVFSIFFLMFRFLIILLIFVGAMETHYLFFCGNVPEAQCDFMKNPPVSVNYSKVICALSLALVLFIKIRVKANWGNSSSQVWKEEAE